MAICIQYRATSIPLTSIMIVDLGDHDLLNATESPNRVFKAAKLIPHIQHDVITNDIALIMLEKKIEFTKAISPVCLPPREMEGILIMHKI